MQGRDERQPADASLDRYARMVQRYLDVPTALVSLVEPDRQVFPGVAGLGEPWASTRETPLSHSFCQYVVADEAPLIVSDSRTEDRLEGNGAITDLGVIAYAGWPLIDEAGATIGSLCAIDDEPRQWTREDLDALADLADACSAEMMYRRRQQDAQEMSLRSQVLLALSEGLSFTRTLDDVAYAVEQVAVDHLGCLHAGIWLVTPPEPGSGDSETLRYVSDPTARWSSAARNSRLGLDATNPLGDCVVTGKPLFFSRKAVQNVRYPELDLSEQVGEARAFVPLGLNGSLGVLVLLWDAVRDVTPGERVTLATLASYVAQAVQRALIMRDREQASLTLQSAMISRLPEADGLGLEARYRPAAVHDRVGGDWYDAVVGQRGEVNLMVGDVAGHDIAAAAVMGELRSVLRAFAWGTDDCPASNVTRLDQAMASFGLDRFASLLFARIQPPDASGTRSVHWTNAGHFPPLLLLPDGSTQLLGDEGPADLVVGVDPDTVRRNQTAEIPPGSVLLLFTDGLVERRDEAIDAGLDRLLEVTARNAHEPAEEFLDAVVEDMVGASHEDDVAVLAVRFR